MELTPKQIEEMEQLARDTLMGFCNAHPQPLAIPAGWYRSWIDLPERKSGKMTVEHYIKKDSTPIIGHRQALLRGVPPATAKIGPDGLKVTQLCENGGVWMSDLPEELFQIEEAIAGFQPEGDVLVGGLGLGLLATRLDQMTEVASVTVIEKSKDVIKICTPEDSGITTVHGDIFKFLKSNHTAYDCYMLDTWAGTNESTYWSDVFRQRRMIRNRFGARPKIWCWAEDIMRGQVGGVINRQSQFDHWYYTGIPAMSKDEMTWFFDQVGSKAWEKKYGHLPFKG